MTEAEDGRKELLGLAIDVAAEVGRAMARFPHGSYTFCKFTKEFGQVIKSEVLCGVERDVLANYTWDERQAVAILYIPEHFKEIGEVVPSAGIEPTRPKDSAF